MASKTKRIIACFSGKTKSPHRYFRLSGLPSHSIVRLFNSKDLIRAVETNPAHVSLLVLDYSTFARLVDWIIHFDGHALGVSDDPVERHEMRSKGLMVDTFENFQGRIVQILK